MELFNIAMNPIAIKIITGGKQCNHVSFKINHHYNSALARILEKKKFITKVCFTFKNKRSLFLL